MPDDWKLELQGRGLEAAEPVYAGIAIDAGPAEVWNRIAAPGNLKRCHPFCASTAVEKWPGVGSRYSITYYSGIRYQRDFVAWLDGVGYDVEVGSPTKKTCRVFWRIESRAPGHSEFRIEVAPYVEPGWSAGEESHYLERFFGDAFEHYLNCVVKGLKYHVTTGKDVREDQFGANPVFSAPR